MQPNHFFSLSQIIDCQPLTVPPDFPLMEAVGLMQSRGNSCRVESSEDMAASNSSCILVTEDNRLRGIFTERDLVKLIAEETDLMGMVIENAMSREVVTLTYTGAEDIFAALNLLRTRWKRGASQTHSIRHLPIVDTDNNLLGLITAKNLRRKLQPVNMMKWRKVAEIMNTVVVRTDSEDSIRHVAQLMAENQVSCVAICEIVPETDSTLPLGIITERDIVQFQNLNLDLKQPARDVMSSPLFLVSPEDSLWSVHQQMQQHHVRRLLVGGRQGELMGIVTQTSLLQVFDPGEMYGVIESLQQQVCQLELAQTQLLENRQQELEREVRERTAALRTANHQRKAIAEFSQYALATPNFPLILQKAVYLVADTLEVEYCKLLKLLADDSLLLEAGVGWQDSLAGTTILGAGEKSQAEYTLQQSQPVVVDNLQTETRFKPSSLLIDREVISGMSVIIADGGKPYGVLETHSTQQRSFTTDDVNFLSAIANIIAQANERLQIETKLKDSQERFDLAVRGSRDGLWDWNVTTNEVFYAPRFKAILGYTEEEMPNVFEAWSSKLHPEDREATLTAVQSHLENRLPYKVEYRLQTKQGDYCWFYARGQAIWNDSGKAIRMAGSITDISDRKQAEAKLQKSNGILRAISSIQTQYLSDAEPGVIFDGLLEHLLELTESEYGFIGEIIIAEDGSPILEESYMKFRGRPYLKTHAITNIAWNEETRAFYAENAPKGMEFHNLQTLFGAVIVTGKPVIANSPSDDPRRGGLPDGHPPLNAFLGIPFYKNNKMTGMAGIANRPGGYNEDVIEYLRPLLDTCSRIIEAYKGDRARKQAESKIKEQAALLDITTDAIMVRALDNTIVFWNRGAEVLYGWLATEILNHNCDRFFNRTSGNRLIEIQQAVTETGEWQGELKQVTKSGQEIIVESRWTLVENEAGAPSSYLVVNTDITEQKQLEAQFLRTQRLESLGTLAGGIAHDLNNILAPILGFAKLLPLKLPDVDEQTKGFFKIMENNAQRGTALVKQILTFSRGLEGDKGIVQIRHLINEIGQIITETFPKAIELTVDAPKTLWTVNADVNQLHQVLMNLCVNARDAMPNGGKLSIQAENFTIDSEYARLHLDAEVGNYIKITVTDTGVGIPPEVIDRIFEPFFTTKEIGRGTGLGLSTVIGIVKGHGGFIEVTSDRKQTRETQFQVFLPASDTLDSPTAVNEAIPLGNGELILVVDDESSILEATKATLETYNYRTITANNGIEAVAIYANNKEAVSLIIMDIMMPGMDGKTAIRTLKQIDPDAKIIAVSGLITSQEIIKELDEEVIAFLSKPYSNEDLLETVYKIVSE